MKYKTNGKLTSKQKTSIKLYIKEKDKKKSFDHIKHEEESVSRLDRTSKYLPGKAIAWFLLCCSVFFYFILNVVLLVSYICVDKCCCNRFYNQVLLPYVCRKDCPNTMLL